MRVALTREISVALERCELTHLAREPIDIGRAGAQHAAYEERLRAAGCSVVRLPADDRMPDSVFIEDVAVVLDELAVVTRPGALSRRIEAAAVAEALRPYRALHRIQPPGTMDGGDVLVAGRRVFVGDSSRTNRSGFAQLEALLRPLGYDVQAVAVRGCLHLKSAVTAISDEAVLLNPASVNRGVFARYDAVEVDPREPGGANAVRAGDSLIYPAGFPRTRDRLKAGGFDVAEVDVGELAKAEGAVTCCSLIFTAAPADDPG